MPSFGVLVIKNPGPNTEVELRGVSGYYDEDYVTFTQALEEQKLEEACGHKAYTVVAFDTSEGDGFLQVELGYDMDQARDSGCLTDKEEEQYTAKNDEDKE